MATIIVFASSLVASLTLISFKAFEIKKGNKHFILEFINRLDSRLDKLVVFLKFKGLQFIQTVRYIVLIKMRDLAQNFFHKAQERLASEIKLRQEIMMGKKDIMSKGSVSFYLKKITEDKGHTRRGKIEESL